MKNRKIKINAVPVIVVTLLSFFALSPLSSFGGDLAEAEGFQVSADGVSYPYTDTFTISAYYSPLPCQQKYATGNYEADIRLNGHGVHGADGTDVYPGMVAAPRSYPFGTKLYIPGIGIVAVHDRGGAIVDANGDPNRHDRLDIWMGYGDIGLKRALAWGKRNVDVTVYGLNDQLSEQISLAGYSADEAIPQSCESNDVVDSSNVTLATSSFVEKPEVNLAVAETPKEVQMPYDGTMPVNLYAGAAGNAVKSLQNELKMLNYYKVEPTGVYDELTAHAVFKFQQAQGIVAVESETGSGVFGPTTRSRMNEIISLRNYTRLAIENKKNSDSNSANLPEETKQAYIPNTLALGSKGNEVKKLQEFLKKTGYFKCSIVTDYYGEITKEAVVQFQMANKIISGESDKGAGVVGPETLKKINELG
ncbi:MAG: peptidoglycan-binding protein [Candidatus Gracilibacteria bacterium]|jgi:peptidoglycan hydrolase-like protein with peptidoglycan-binding domain/3D (Asp-Asp-Asp) domain-containing protein